MLERVKDIAKQAGARLKIVRCVVDREVRMLRLRSREARLSQLTADELSDEQEHQMFAHLPVETLVLDTSRSLKVCVNEGLAYLQQ